jgi:uncharacterized protein (DUF1800 family)
MAITVNAAQQALIAYHRFGLGPKAGGAAAIAADAKAALRREVNTAGMALIADPTLPSYVEACRQGALVDIAPASAVLQREIDARIDKHLVPQIGFVERLVIFWSNHFSMSIAKNRIIRSTIGHVEREVIRRHVLGKFSDMLIGVVKHPAMLAYLDNAGSVGPGSIAGISSRLGFNENLAREILELHTLGGAGGQTEADVRAFTRILTGWSFVRQYEADGNLNGGNDANRGQYIFRANWHEPDPIAMMGKIYLGIGEGQAEQVMQDLAIHPATAQHLAFKLVQHFITDTPTPAMVNPIRNAFINSGGDLKAVAIALINLPASWSEPLKKVRTPYELLVGQFRALGYRYTAAEYPIHRGMLSAMQQPTWECPSPTGYSDDTLQWLNPDGMTLRIDTALRSARNYGARFTKPVPAWAFGLYDKALSLATRERIAGAGGSVNALTVLFCSPEFQRR